MTFAPARRSWISLVGVAAIAGLSAMGCASETAPVDEQVASEVEENALVNVDHTDVERQSIGNCWIYAHASWVESMHKTATGEAFDASQSYWTYWHWFESITGKSGFGALTGTEIETGGSWQVANNLVRRYGLIAEKDFVPEDTGAEMSSRQKDALTAINVSLKSGALSTAAARRDAKLVRAELDKAWRLGAPVVAQLDAAFGKDGARTFVTGGGGTTTGTSIVRPQSFKVSYPSRSSTGKVTLKSASLVSAMNDWKQMSYGSDRAGFQLRLKRALHAASPVIITWSVDFNAMENGNNDRRGSFNMTTLNEAGGPGRQGGHMTVLEDYQVKLASGEVLLANVDTTDPAKLAAALEPGAKIEFLQVKNSWGGARPDRAFAAGMPGYHNLYMDYLDGPITWCRDGEGTGTPASRGCTSKVTPLKNVVVPPGFDRLASAGRSRFVGSGRRPGPIAFLRPRSDPEPGAGIERLAALADLEVQHRPRALVADGAEARAGRHLVADLHVDGAEVSVDGVVVLAVVDDHDASVVAVARREGDASGVHGAHGRS